jgi:hypothetical protein
MWLFLLATTIIRYISHDVLNIDIGGKFIIIRYVKSAKK